MSFPLLVLSFQHFSWVSRLCREDSIQQNAQSLWHWILHLPFLSYLPFLPLPLPGKKRHPGYSDSSGDITLCSRVVE